jgi:hypothetical protein
MAKDSARDREGPGSRKRELPPRKSAQASRAEQRAGHGWGRSCAPRWRAGAVWPKERRLAGCGEPQNARRGHGRGVERKHQGRAPRASLSRSLSPAEELRRALGKVGGAT